MSYENIDVQVDGAVTKLVLNRPKSLNSFNESMHAEVAAALDEVGSGSGCRALLLTGAGRGFCAGQDLSDRQVMPGEAPPDLGDTLGRLYNPLIRKLRSLPLPVVCAVNGVAAGAGANIALACDIVLAARSAKFIQSFSRVGLIPDSGGSWILPRLVGHARASGLAILGTPLTAEQAEAWGVIWQCVDDDELMTEAEGLCQQLATQPTHGLALMKQALVQSWANPLDAQLDLEQEYQQEAGRSDDYREGVSAFMEKREPSFKGK